VEGGGVVEGGRVLVVEGGVVVPVEGDVVVPVEGDVAPVVGEVAGGGVVAVPVEAGGFPNVVPVAGGVVVPVAGGFVVEEAPVPVGVEPAEIREEVEGSMPDPQPASARLATAAHIPTPFRDTFKRITLLS
jgi:hypothetical protein